MERVIKFGLMAASTRGSGNKIRPMGTENLYTLTEIFMKEIGQTTKQMGKEHTHTQTVLNTLAHGRMINNMGPGWSSGWMGKNIRESIKMERKQGRGD